MRSRKSLSILVPLLAGAVYAADEGAWQRLMVKDDAPVLIRDIAIVENQFFALDVAGALYHGKQELTERLELEPKAELSTIWGLRANDVYAVGSNGVVARFDGQKLAVLGEPIASVFREIHVDMRATPKEVKLTHVLAISPNDVYAAGEPAVIVHFDGKKWSEVDIGVRAVQVSDNSRLGTHLEMPRVGPIWGTSIDRVWIRKEITKTSENGRFSADIGSEISHLNGQKWNDTGQALPVEGWEKEGRSPCLASVRILSSGVLTRFEGAIHEWDAAEQKWSSIARLPEGRWEHWTAADKEHVLIYGYDRGFHLWDGKSWNRLDLPGPPLTASVAKIDISTDRRLLVMLNFRGQAFKLLLK